MNIRAKVVTSCALVSALLVAALLLIESRIVMPSFAQLEQDDALTAMRRVSYALDLALERLTLSARDWGNWAETWHFVADGNRSYVQENLTEVSLRQLDVDVLLVVDGSGRVVNSGELAGAGDAAAQDLAPGGWLPADFAWRDALSAMDPRHGLLGTRRGVYLIASAPILDGAGGGPARGRVILARLLTPAEVAGFGAQTQVDVSVGVPGAHEPREQLLETTQSTRVLRTVDDLDGRPVLRVAVEVPRRITARGRAALNIASACLVLAALAVVLLLVLVLDRVVLAPLRRVTAHAVAVGEQRELRQRLALDSDDEMGVLARELDLMVQRLEESRRQLADKSFEAGVAELARGVLHNLGNAMTPIGVRISKLRALLRSAPTQDARRAVDELGLTGTDPARRAQLQEFVRLACQRLTALIESATQELESTAHQVSMVQSAISEQLTVARGPQLIEPLRLTELVGDALQLVPDAARQRLRVETGEGLRGAGVIRGPRTVLRLVLQNLLVNAADAIRAAGREQGAVLLDAARIEQDGRIMLHLSCRDDGAGIAPEHITRVFEKGFSTKSRETNCGIGLHWCANALNAAGGRIWAESDGPGCGSTFHVLLPLERAAAAVPAAAEAA